MHYRKNKLNGDELSVLGFGCMRFPKNEKETEELILYAIENGVNYFDTAYMYRNSEETLGRILNKHNKRNKVKIATKIPPYAINKYDDFDKIFNIQLARLQTDYIDYYFLHGLSDVGIWKRITNLGMEKWINEKKAEGKIKNIGFSYHGGREEFIKICNAYSWEFCMIQYNYMDENTLASKDGLHYAANIGLPVMIMEPLRGGNLANKLPKAAVDVFKEAYIKRSPAEWSFRWIWNQQEATCVLSGMNDMDNLKENIEIASSINYNNFTQKDFDVIENAKKVIEVGIKVSCTGCGYCIPCPQGVDIPTCLSCYNDTATVGKAHAFAKYIMHTSMKSKPQIASLCNGCGMCETKCPQKIEIRKELQNTVKSLHKFYFKPVSYIARRFIKL
jgi:predicted aldo/keto reductase-like oxidoreductase